MNYSANQMDLMIYTGSSFEDMVATCQKYFGIIPNKHIEGVDPSKYEPAFPKEDFGSLHTLYCDRDKYEL